MGPPPDLPSTDRGRRSSSQKLLYPDVGKTKNNDIYLPLPSISSPQSHNTPRSMTPSRDKLSPLTSPAFRQTDMMSRGAQMPSSPTQSNHLLLGSSDFASPPGTPRRDGSRTPRAHTYAQSPTTPDDTMNDLTKMFSNKISDFLESLSDHEDEPGSPLPRSKRFRTLSSPSPARPSVRYGRKGMLRTVPLPDEDEKDPEDPFICLSPRSKT
ncbi:hypothetical protein K435DRAFT_848952 [Dendrothele bispora CBS 962.96]|uniref:Uncharacterized protein n=1 Tax=Dendrothele bispora (strain CBS 962.96) TaxID=1314807 RepID=A0A4S8MTF7_DENBC|nr:hypothetical protein K435DRAFT_848952 [Dendrothele bispora CBS 962.96]